ncbi:hypothetical protein [Caballeronia sordidicola]|jgi:hypothetical protein|uniref:Uncharacterized protein n=3 Tax=Caballeronia sordidicola TaxID=196367 RepID=A0A226X1B5_CABSO|nr:hypothetical protein [Caballeronia sordidicola]OXC75472.1 hypothetical protein BSU04_26835 [Caballeronia sordidicola]OXC76678.1 hypothetical protein BSU04_20530 [Caballeronia sordidicola]OXC76744.1 hypothetical protein BSU04_20520 [Caballeronia sordidicola]
MTRLNLPSGITQGLNFLIPENWSADQALAVVELLDDLRERICMHYQLELLELQHQQRANPKNAHPNDVDDPF